MTGSFIVGDQVLNFMGVINNVNPILFSLPLIGTEVKSIRWLTREKLWKGIPWDLLLGGWQELLSAFDGLSVQSIQNP